MTRSPRAFVALLMLTGLLAACTAAPGSEPTTSPVSSPSPSVDASFDRQFIDMMVPHHQSAVEMAKIAQDRGEHPEIKQLAGEIMTAQDAEIAQMRSWRNAWFGSDSTPPMDAVPMLPGMDMGGHGTGGDMMDMTADIEALRSAEPFDRAFIEMMTVHHESAIAAARLAEQQAERPEIKQLAGEIIAAQETEIREMKDWLDAWY